KELCRAVYFFDFLPDTSAQKQQKTAKNRKKTSKITKNGLKLINAVNSTKLVLFTDFPRELHLNANEKALCCGHCGLKCPLFSRGGIVKFQNRCRTYRKDGHFAGKNPFGRGVWR
ncbi:MAG TPA: hypothetical protein PKK36_08915, partial [Kiritimatiellia bacterium]|nr:hypothetical protein [Kiritimatiellia bacterium]HPA78874.1 hypothetical protein [Kiritimatiellia bacterium]HQQ05021.1 hypothetical protein [Kiritimatiellia bacterium]